MSVCFSEENKEKVIQKSAGGKYEMESEDYNDGRKRKRLQEKR